MSNPKVSIELALEPKDISAALAEISSKIKAGLGSISLKSIKPKEILPSIAANLEKFRTFETTISKTINTSINNFYKLKSAISNTVSGSKVLLAQLPDILDAKLSRGVNKAINTFYKLKTASQNVLGTLSQLTAKDVFWRLTLSAKKLKDTILNMKIRPGAFLDVFKVFNVSRVVNGLKAVRHGADIAIGSFVKLRNGAMRLASGFAGLTGKVYRFIFSLKGMAAAAGVGAAFYGIFNTAAVAEDIERAQWKFNVVFNEIRENANKTAKGIADTFKANIGSIQSQMARAADVVKPLGLDQKTILEMTRNIGLLSQGAEAWTEGRYDAERASTALMKALTGEKEMLKEFGVVITDQEVWDAIKSQGKEMTRAAFAVAIYNKILERTPDLQKAAFDRIKEFTGRLAQFRESFKTLRGAIGDFTKPIVTAFLNLGAVVNRKLAEILGATGFRGWKDLSVEIAQKIDNIARSIASIDPSHLAASFKIMKESLVDFSKNILDFFADGFVGLGKLLGQAIVEGFKIGLDYFEGEGAGVTRKWADDIYQILRYGGTDPMYKRPFGSEPGGSVPEDFLSRAFTADLETASAKFKASIDMLAKDLSRLQRVNRSGADRRQRPRTPGFGAQLPIPGPKKQVSPEDIFKLRTIDTARWKLLKQEEFLRKDLAKAENTREASLSGLKDIYFNMLTRAAGGKKDAATSIEKLQFKIEDIEKQQKRERDRAHLLLAKIEANTGRSRTEILRATFGR